VNLLNGEENSFKNIAVARVFGACVPVSLPGRHWYVCSDGYEFG
jgi:hypothetical protein